MFSGDVRGADWQVVVLEVLDEESGGPHIAVDGVRAEIAGYEMTLPACGQGLEVVYNSDVAVLGPSSTF